MTPAQAIKMLDDQLRRHGEPVMLHTVVAGVPDAGTAARAFVRGYKPDELAGDLIKQGDRRVTVSPTTVPAPPALNSKISVAGKMLNVQAVEPRRLNGVLVRIELQVRG